MNEDRLRSALRQARVKVDDPDAWNDVRTRARRIHRHRRVAQSAVALVVVVAAALGALAAGGAFDADADRSIIATPSEQQGEIVVAFDDRIVVMTTDGEIVRTVLDGLDFVGNISVTPDGEYVYFAYGGQCDFGDSPKVARVRLAGGPVERIGRGLQPLVSPNGERVAWELTDPKCGSLKDRIVVAAPDGSDSYRYGAGPDDAVIALEPLAWAPDSRELVVATEQFASPGSRLMMRMPLVGTAHPISPGYPAATFLADGALLVASRAGDGYVVGTATDAAPGVVRYEAEGAVPRRLVLEPNGNRLLVLGADRSLQMQEGVNAPQVMAIDVEGAAWLPKAGPRPVPTTTVAPMITTTTVAPSPVDDAPAAVVTLTDVGDLIEIDTATGSRTRAIANVGPLSVDPQIAVSPDGATVYAERRHGLIDCPSGDDVFANEIVAVDRASGRVEVVDRGRWPTVSPDGSALAYVQSDGCNGRTSVAIRRFDVGGMGSYPSGTLGTLVPPIEFSPDSEHMLVHLILDARRYAFEWHTESEGGLPNGREIPPVPPSINESGFVAERYLAATGLMVTAHVGHGTIVYSIDPAQGTVADILYQVQMPVPVGWSLDAVDPSGRHLLLVTRTAETTYLTHGEIRPSRTTMRLGPDGVVAAAWAP